MFTTHLLVHQLIQDNIMAHYAELDDNNRVIRIIVIDNDHEPTEADGIAYCENLFKGGRWIKTSYNASIRKNFAGIDFIYDHKNDAFIPPKPFPSWVFNQTNYRWTAPIAYPSDNGNYYWDEYTQSWKLNS